MRFRVLGPLEVNTATDARAVTPRAAKVRGVLATLLVRSNEVVSVDGLIDELWGENPPRTAMTTLQVYISQLRKLLREVQPEFGREALVTRSPGYRLRVDPNQLDLTVFEELHSGGRDAMERGDHAAAADLQRQALALWRGPLLSDTPHGSLLHSMAVRLAEVRTAALEQRIRAELHLGHHQELLGELQALAAELPLHEEFHAHLMVALYRTGRQADALRAFGKLRRTLVDELAIEPGRRLQQLHSRILTGDPALLRPSDRRPRAGGGAERPQPLAVAAPPTPRTRPVEQLPAADPLFTGRDGELERLASRLRDLPGGGCAQVTGPAGVGKTALAVAVAHRTRELFPDGRALVGLRGDDGRPLNSTQILGRILVALGVREPLPVAVAELRELLRQSTEGRRLLLILDDAADAAQLRPLLPLPAGCAALVTARPVLPGLGGHLLAIDALSAPDARLLLTAAAGRSSAARPAAAVTDGEYGEYGTHGEYGTQEAYAPAGPPAPGELDALDALGEIDAVQERDDWDELAELCGRWPSALRAVASRLAAHPHHSPAELAARLRGPETRLAELRAADEDCHAALRAPYDNAPEPVRRAARLLSLLPEELFTVTAAAAALGARVEAAERTLRALVAAGLLGTGPDGRGYRFPALTRLLAVEQRNEQEPKLWVRAAVARLCAAAADRAETARHAARMDGQHPLDWFARRQNALVALTGQAHEAGLWAQTVRLAEAMAVFLEALAAWDPWQRTHTLAVDAAERVGDDAARSRLLRSLGDLAWQRHRPDAARDLYQRAVDAAGSTAAPERGRALAGLADVQLDAGAGEAAARLVTPTLRETPDDARGCYEARRVLGLLALETEGPAAAHGHFRQCLTLAGALGDRRLEAYARRWLDRLDRDAPLPAWVEVRPGAWRTLPAPHPTA
ncbi:AfsR/SARP family transcriptional regulator [Streptomyces sp. O3]